MIYIYDEMNIKIESSNSQQHCLLMLARQPYGYILVDLYDLECRSYKHINIYTDILERYMN